MNFDKIVKERRSIRKYSQEKIKTDKILEALDLARFTPMAGNIFTVRFIVVQDSEKKHEIAKASLEQYFIEQASHLIVVCSDKEQCERMYGNFAEKYTRQQAGATIQTILLKLTEKKIATCWIGAFDENIVKRILRIPENWNVEAIITAGKKSKTIKIEKPRKPDLNNLIYFDVYGQKTEKRPKIPRGE